MFYKVVLIGNEVLVVSTHDEMFVQYTAAEVCADIPSGDTVCQGEMTDTHIY